MCPQLRRIELEPAILRRGFWLYVFRACVGDQVLLYVGRTGDNRPPQAASPYDRFGQHLGITNTAANGFRNYLAPHLGDDWEANLQSLDFRCWGPIFEPVVSKAKFDAGTDHERQDWAEEHARRRKIVGGLERRLAEELDTRGYDVLNTVRDRNEVASELWEQLEQCFLPQFPAVTE